MKAKKYKVYLDEYEVNIILKSLLQSLLIRRKHPAFVSPPIFQNNSIAMADL